MLTRIPLKPLACATLLSAVAVLLPAPAQAYNTFNGHKLTYGIVNQEYWIDPDVDPHIGGVVDAMGRWNATGVENISYSRTWTKANSRMDWYQVDFVSPNWWGITGMYVNTSTVDPMTQNWTWAKIRLDGDFANCPNRGGVMAHEAGHAMGLAHVNGGNPRLMRENIAEISTTAPWDDDKDGIRALY